MKILSVLSLVQIAAILFLYTKVAGIDEYLQVRSPVEQAIPVETYVADTQGRNDSGATYSYQDEDRLRAIIREELAALPLPASQADNANAYRSVNPAEIEYQREQVAQQLEYHISVGTISEVDMARLQMEIATLDEAGRREMLGALTRAMNSGRLDGRL